jgi:hypothetical protein
MMMEMKIDSRDKDEILRDQHGFGGGITKRRARIRSSTVVEFFVWLNMGQLP